MIDDGDDDDNNNDDGAIKCFFIDLVLIEEIKSL